ncbi:MAG: GIY-YIG nuclease family protein [Syntrophobacteria bacterium]
MYFVYVLRNPEGRLYIGFTSDLERRVLQHQRGEGGWTRLRGPWKVVFTEKYAARPQAMRREKFLKSGQGRAFIKGILATRAGPPQAD